MARPSLRQWLLIVPLIMAACSPQPSAPKAAGQGAHYKVGEPYQVAGNWYMPKEDYSYDETGIASWYGADFNRGTTANGEIFNKNELTAAHKTLPLPTLARVTNLDNGRSIVVRIIDVSQRAAQLLGFEQQGTAKVRVQVLADESKAIADAMRHYGTAPPPVEIAGATGAPVAAVETKTLEPVRTTPVVHEQLIATRPVQEVVMMPVAAGHNRLFVQAGAFTVLENATKLKQRLSPYGPVTLSDIVVNGRLFHRVRLGPVADVPQADQLLLKVRKAGIENARTVVD
jgi:rare lipoprotein A